MGMPSAKTSKAREKAGTGLPNGSGYWEGGSWEGWGPASDLCNVLRRREGSAAHMHLLSKLKITLVIFYKSLCLMFCKALAPVWCYAESAVLHTRDTLVSVD